MSIKTSGDLMNKNIPQNDLQKRPLALLMQPMLLPFLLTRLHLDYTATAFIVTTTYVTSSIAQPIFGLTRHPHLSRIALPLGVLLACASLAMAAQMHSYGSVLLCVVLSSLGIAQF